MGDWKGKVDLTLATMDDFQVVLGIDFLRQVKDSKHEFAMHYRREYACMLPLVQGTNKTKVMLSAMQLSKAFRINAHSHISTLGLPSSFYYFIQGPIFIMSLS